MSDALASVVAYHEQTKHLPGRFARSRGYLDWETQPDPFRLFAGAPRLDLEQVPAGDDPAFDQLFDPHLIRSRDLDRSMVSQLFFDSLAISAWKKAGANRWSLRCNPSSGNLHPTEGYLFCPPVFGDDWHGGLFHYSPLLHALEQRRAVPGDLVEDFFAGLPQPSVLVGLTSIHWREAWKYGERAFRYCQLDVGHAIAALSYAAAAMGWSTHILDSFSGHELGDLLAVSDQTGPEVEHPDCIMLVTPGCQVDWSKWQPDHGALAAVTAIDGAGTANQLSRAHQLWPVIDEVASASIKDTISGDLELQSASRPNRSRRPKLAARRLFHQRRSAVDMDGKSRLSRPDLLKLVTAMLEPVPACTLTWPPAIHPVLWLHRVDDFEPGAYLLVRNETARRSLREALDQRFLWRDVDGAPPQLQQLEVGDRRAFCAQVSCQQSIASDGVLAVCFLAHFEPRLSATGPWFYRRLYWEAGLLGQILYIEAEAAGLRGTGIGCYFDDLVHHYLGIEDRSFQALYNFTIGGPVEDSRLQTLNAYFHLPELRQRLDRP